MQACLAAEAASGWEAFDTATVSRLLTTSGAIPFAVVRGGRFAFANPAFLSLFRAGADMVGLELSDVIDQPDRPAIGRLLADPVGPPVTFRGRALRQDGTAFDAELAMARDTLDGVAMLCVFGENVGWRQLSEQHLSDLAYTDVLTGLANRARVLDRLRDALVEARGGGGLAVFMADLDGLKQVNDSCGHQAGDVVLQTIAQRFLRCIRDRDTLARLGGDEFCLVLPGVRDDNGTEKVAARLVEAARQPVAINGRKVGVGVSVGIALFPQNGDTPDELIAAADAALYEAKRAGKDRYATASALVAPAAVAVPPIAWTAAYDVGIAEIDHQHRELARRLNELAGALGRGDEPAVVLTLLAAVFEESQHHFATEERLMEQHGYVGAAAHRASHAHLLEDLRNFSAGHSRHSMSLVTRFLQEWLLRHVDGADRRMAAALRAGGVR